MPLQPIAIVIALSVPIPDACPDVLRVIEGGPRAEASMRRLVRLGPVAVPALADGFASRPEDPAAVARLLLVAGRIRDARVAPGVLPYLFAPEPEVAALATRALSLASGGRAAPALEHALATDRSFDQSLAALEGLLELRLPTSFGTLSRYAADPAHDPVLRAMAASALPRLDRKQTRRWLNALPVPDDMSPFLRTRLDLMRQELAGPSGREPETD